MGKTIGMVRAKARAIPVNIPVENIPVAMPAFSRGTHVLTSLGKLVNDQPSPTP